MNGSKFLLDTCFILGFYKRDEKALALAKTVNLKIEDCHISTINRLEVLGYHDMTDTDEIGLTKLLSNFRIYSLTKAIEEKTIDLRKRHKIKLPDAIVLATTLTHHCHLLTLDNGLNNKFLVEIND